MPLDGRGYGSARWHLSGGKFMLVRDKEGYTHQVDAEEAQRLIESGEAEPVAEALITRAEDTDSERAKRAERRTG